MSDALTDFLDGLAARGHEPLLATTTGRVGFEVAGGDERRVVSIDNGQIAVVADDSSADCTLRASRDTLERVAAGEMNAMAAALRGAITIEGNWELLVRFQRVFPAPVGVEASAPA